MNYVLRLGRTKANTKHTTKTTTNTHTKKKPTTKNTHNNKQNTNTMLITAVSENVNRSLISVKRSSI